MERLLRVVAQGKLPERSRKRSYPREIWGPRGTFSLPSHSNQRGAPIATATSGRVKLDSTTLEAAGYDARRETLQLDFRDGTRYMYSGVAPNLYRELLHAVSKGSFLTVTFGTAFLMSKWRPKTKRHWAAAAHRRSDCVL
jgi:hypothetical protein